jgi:hypothetical protein
VELDVVRRRQRGILSRSQALAAGLSPAMIRARLDSGRWQRLSGGTYATFSGEVSPAQRRWGALLRAGRGSVLSHRSAAEEAGFAAGTPGPVHVTVEAERRVGAVAGIVVHRSRHIKARRHPTRMPPQTRVEETVLDLAVDAIGLDEAMGWIAAACGQRLTTPARVGKALAARERMHRRRELEAALADVALGCHSVLEGRYLRDVEAAHGLPEATRQHMRRRAGGAWYDDVHYAEHAVRVELDGRAAHPAAGRWRDHRRDNAAAEAGDMVLRYGYSDVTERPCQVARQVAAVLTRNGWRGRMRSCGLNCAASRAP